MSGGDPSLKAVGRPGDVMARGATGWGPRRIVDLLRTAITPTTDNAVVRFDGASGALQNSTVVLTDAGAVSGITTIANSGIQTNTNNTTATNTSSGALVVTGGVGIGGALFSATFGIQASSGNVFAIASTSEGASQVSGPATGAGLVLGTHGSLFQADGAAIVSDSRFGFRPKGSTTIAGARFICNSTSEFYIDAGTFDAGGSYSASKILNLNVSGGDIKLGGALWMSNAYVGTPQVPTGYIVIKDSTGTAYKVPCNV